VFCILGFCQNLQNHLSNSFAFLKTLQFPGESWHFCEFGSTWQTLVPVTPARERFSLAAYLSATEAFQEIAAEALPAA
jgi:hypothetical protein